MPSDFRFGLIKPVLKDKYGDTTSTDMYRSITLLPVMSKLFELVFLQLYGDFLTSDNLQFGFKKRLGALMPSLLLPNLSNIFTARRYASAVLAVIVCLSVRLSVCLSQVGVVQRWLNLGSN